VTVAGVSDVRITEDFIVSSELRVFVFTIAGERPITDIAGACAAPEHAEKELASIRAIHAL